MPSDFWSLLGLGALVVFALFTFTWLLSLRLDNFSFVDVTWSYALAFLAPVYASLGGGWEARKCIALAMALGWSVRPKSLSVKAVTLSATPISTVAL